MTIFIIGVLVGWITKIPFLIKWYRELREEKQRRSHLYDKLMKFEEYKIELAAENDLLQEYIKGCKQRDSDLVYYLESSCRQKNNGKSFICLSDERGWSRLQ